MQHEVIRDLAQAIVSEALLGNWRFWLPLLSLTGVVAALGAFGGSFLRKRGETAAIKRDLDELLTQLRQTTAVATETKTAIERIDWLDREWRKVRREKLEQLLAAVYDLETWLDHMKDKWLHADEAKAEPRAIERVKLLATLYFPELATVAEDAWKAHVSAYQYILEAGSPAGGAVLDKSAERYGEALDAFTAGWPEKYLQVRTAVASLESEASMLMQKIARA